MIQLSNDQIKLINYSLEKYKNHLILDLNVTSEGILTVNNLQLMLQAQIKEPQEYPEQLEFNF